MHMTAIQKPWAGSQHQSQAHVSMVAGSKCIISIQCFPKGAQQVIFKYHTCHRQYTHLQLLPHTNSNRRGLIWNGDTSTPKRNQDNPKKLQKEILKTTKKILQNNTCKAEVSHCPTHHCHDPGAQSCLLFYNGHSKVYFCHEQGSGRSQCLLASLG